MLSSNHRASLLLVYSSRSRGSLVLCAVWCQEDVGRVVVVQDEMVWGLGQILSFAAREVVHMLLRGVGG